LSEFSSISLRFSTFQLRIILGKMTIGPMHFMELFNRNPRLLKASIMRRSVSLLCKDSYHLSYFITFQSKVICQLTIKVKCVFPLASYEELALDFIKAGLLKWDACRVNLAISLSTRPKLKRDILHQSLKTLKKI